MLLKYIFLLFVCIIVDARYPSYSRCSYPNIKNGIPRLRQRGNFVRFSCFSRYILMGNKYATCRNGAWDVPLPVCIRPGCDKITPVTNAVTQTYHNDAWMLFFCFPGNTLVGSPVIYCDGRHWNATAPKCVDSSAPVKTSCDFEEADICGWEQDELHDFDWRRLNKETPSSLYMTGPQYDHTLGRNGSGYYMYIESSNPQPNDTARLISPVFNESLAKDGCFVFYYNMNGRGMGGLRVYQKPDNMNLFEVLRYNMDGRNKYMLFEQWGNQGSLWYAGVARLLDVHDDFQIVIEGIRGVSFMSDLAIDDVAILQGENCSNIINDATTPTSSFINEESCVGRCLQQYVVTNYPCECHILCVIHANCCPDYLEVCEFIDGFPVNGSYAITDDDTTTISSTTIELPQTQKLVATTNTTTSTTTTITPKTSYNPPKITGFTPTRWTTPWTSRTTSITTTSSTTTRRPIIRSTSTSTTTKLPSTTTTTFSTTTTKRTTPLKLNTSVSFTTKVIPTSSTKKLVRMTTIGISVDTVTLKEQSKGTNGVLTTITVLLVLCACCAVLYGTYRLRTVGGLTALSRLRGRTTSDPEVRFLNSDIDDDVCVT